MLFIYHVDILWEKNRSGKSAHMGILQIKLNGCVVIEVTHLKACKGMTQPMYCTLYLLYSVARLPKHFFCRCLYQYMQLALSEVWETQGRPISNPHCWKIKPMRGCCETAVLPKIPIDPQGSSNKHANMCSKPSKVLNFGGVVEWMPPWQTFPGKAYSQRSSLPCLCSKVLTLYHIYHPIATLSISLACRPCFSRNAATHSQGSKQGGIG